MDVALKDRENESFAEPAAIPSDLKPVLRSNGYFVDATSLVNDLEDNPDAGSLILALYQNTHSILHYVNKDDPRGPYPSNPGEDSQYYLWEYGVTRWKNNQFMSILGENGGNTNQNNGDVEINLDDLQLNGEEVGRRQ